MNDSISRRLILPDAALLEIRGPDAVRYLNGQITQDARLVTDGMRALPTCVTDAKGKLQFRAFIHGASGDALRISCDHVGSNELLARLDRYLIADDAELEDISASWRRVHVTGGKPTAIEGAYVVSANRIGVLGWDVWIPVGVRHPVDELEAWDESDVETVRIEAGIPVWGRELLPGMLPPEAGLEKTDISYAKGCYIGQEVISRIKSAGKVNRRLMRLKIDASVEVSPEAILKDEEGREVGELTSIAPQSKGESRSLLGYVKRIAGGSLFLEGEHTVTVRQSGMA